jgi:hypothetical protein
MGNSPLLSVNPSQVRKPLDSPHDRYDTDEEGSECRHVRQIERHASATVQHTAEPSP